jgi:hypothetical protein
MSAAPIGPTSVILAVKPSPSTVSPGSRDTRRRIRSLPGHTATLTCEDGNRKAVCGKAIEYTDFPLPAFELYFANSTISLPSEY